MNLHSDKEAFCEIIALAADKFACEQSHVEKDYWVSKVYGLIDRFSEDLDLFVFTGDVRASRQAEKTLNRKLSKYIIERNRGIYREELSETGGNYRKLYFSYDNVFRGVGLKDHLEVEIKSCDLFDKRPLYCPTDRMVIKPIVTIFLEGKGQTQLIELYGLDGFEMQCINPRRTICDKISRLVKLSYGATPFELLAKHIRDIYDLLEIYRCGEYKAYIHSEEFLDAMYRVTIEDKLSKNSFSHLPLSEALVFRDAETVMSHPGIVFAYSSDLRKLCFNKRLMPPLSEAVATLKALREVLLRFDGYRVHREWHAK